MRRALKALIVIVVLVAAGVAISILVRHYFAPQQITLEGAVLVRNDDVDKQVPIVGVEVSVSDDRGALHQTWTSSTGLFNLSLARNPRERGPLILQFRHPQYLPLNLPAFPNHGLCVARLEPVEESGSAGTPARQTGISHVTVKYSINSTSLVNAGSIVKTFRVSNIGNVPCNSHWPCSPDERWKASIGTANLDAPPGDTFLNARVACIAGPCPFTNIRSNGFSRGGPTLHVAVLDWSDPTVFLFEAEVFRSLSSGSTRISYPVIFGQTMHFTVPGSAEGVYLEADVDQDSIVFPLGPEPYLGWATCTERVEADHAKAYQCQLKPGFAFSN